GHGDRLRLGSFGEADFDLVVLHRRVEELLDDRPQAVDLVDEEDVPFAKIGERANQIARLLERRSRCRSNVDAELARNELGESCLAESGWAEEECMVERLTAGK